jgi:hypothetical protein
MGREAPPRAREIRSRDNGVMSDGFLVGRHHPALLLEEAIGRVFDGQGGLVFVTGEPGIGKTALMTEAGRRAQRRGAHVLFGACWDGDAAPGYWPWVQVLRSAPAPAPATVPLAHGAGTGAPDPIALLLGETDRGAPAPPSGDGVFELHDAVTNRLIACSRDAPVVVILDDLHWADPASLRLVEFVVRHAALDRVVIIGGYRDAEIAEGGHPLRALFAALAPKALTIPLAGIDVDGVEALLVRHGLSDLPHERVAEVHRRTGGNPFFVEQTAHLWNAGGATTAVPPGVADALERRLARLPTPVADLLVTAALLGNEVDRALLAAIGPSDREEVDAAIERAVEARLLAWHGDGSVHFVHDLVRETLCASLPVSEATRRHGAIVRGGAAHLAPARRAHHAVLAVPELDEALARSCLIEATDAAERRAAWEEAAGHLHRALELAGDGSDGERTELLLRLGTAQRRAGLLTEARATYDRLAAAAQAQDDPELYGLAALGAHDLGHAIDDDSKAPEAAIDAAYAALVEHTGGVPQGALAARLLAAVARTRSHLLGGDRREAEEASATAVAVARACGDPGALAFALLARHDAVWRPGTAAEREALTVEMEAAARRAGDLELALQAAMLQSVALLEQGRPRGLAVHQRFVEEADRSPYPRQRYVAASRRAAVATLTGAFDAAATLADDALAYGERLGELDAFGVWGDQVFELHRMRGELGAIDRLSEHLVGSGDPHVVVLRASVAVDRGEREVALAQLDQLRELGERWPQWAALVWLTFVADVAALSGDATLIDAARKSLEPHIDDWAVLAGGVLIHGPMRYFAARLDAATGRHDRAIEAFAAAARAADALGATPWAALSRLGLAASLISRDGAPDPDRARDVLIGVLAEAERLGMAQLADGCRNHLAVLDGGADPRAVPGEREFRRSGDVWWLSFDGLTVQVPEAKGLRDIHTLITLAGKDVAAVDLLDPAGGPALASAKRLGSDAVLDDQAKADFQRRLAELEDIRDRALRRHDDERAVAAELERDALIEELKRAAGLGGRARRLGDEGERARKTVTARIRDSIRKLDRVHPALARHLRDSVITGSWCSYRADGAHGDWRL